MSLLQPQDAPNPDPGRNPLHGHPRLGHRLHPRTRRHRAGRYRGRRRIRRSRITYRDLAVRSPSQGHGKTILRSSGELQVLEVLPLDAVGFAYAETVGKADTTGV
jgi:hypothetical protein